ncbi:uncharacterized protein LOC128609500 [Ictalurus furcatus]|uniref:uncharacterized protein LOC128609500 n=1 Tax=Ictalurus furcatus TaxID=66913 RepID=UPI0023509D9C|nr:uncharacterized protein LOC128609500 [Ictalurus furcatus]
MKQETLLKCLQSKSHPRSNSFHQTTTRSPSGVSSKGFHSEINNKGGSKMASNIHSRRVPAVIKGHRHFSYGGATSPESITVEQYYDLTPSKKSNVRVNDEIIPKPSDINVG